MFPLKKSGSQCIRRKTTGAGTTALNGDIDYNGSITPLSRRVAGPQAVHSDSDNLRASAECFHIWAPVLRLHLTLSRSAGAKPRFALLLLPVPGQSPVLKLMGTSGGLGCHWPLCWAARAPGVTAALCRDAEVRSQWAFWCLPTSSRRTGQAAAPLLLGAPDPQPRVWHCPVLPAVPELCAGPDCSWGFVPAQHISVSASSSGRSRAAHREERGGSGCYF